MAEYIKREDAIRVVEKYFTDFLQLEPDICLDGIRSLPAADVVEYKGGEWTWEGSSWKPLDILEFEWCECSYCQKAVFFYDNQENDYAYCPHCGAKMERGWVENDA